jgi:AraC family transcriptional regulator of adaptative response/methylated-DNA-[protein]-cysteine methyltransferase
MLDTLRDITIEAEAPEFLDGPTGDYERVRRIIAFISERWRDQPSLEAIAEHVGLSTTHVHHLFRRWCGPHPEGVSGRHHARQRQGGAGRLGQRARRCL